MTCKCAACRCGRSCGRLRPVSWGRCRLGSAWLPCLRHSSWGRDLQACCVQVWSELWEAEASQLGSPPSWQRLAFMPAASTSQLPLSLSWLGGSAALPEAQASARPSPLVYSLDVLRTSSSQRRLFDRTHRLVALLTAPLCKPLRAAGEGRSSVCCQSAAMTCKRAYVHCLRLGLTGLACTAQGLVMSRRLAVCRA